MIDSAVIAAALKSGMREQEWVIYDREECALIGTVDDGYSRLDITDLADSLALVVEQHTNGRIAELEARVDEWSADYRKGIQARDNWRARAEKAEATIARVEKLAHDMRGWCSPHGISVTYSDRILAAVRGEPK